MTIFAIKTHLLDIIHSDMIPCRKLGGDICNLLQGGSEIDAEIVQSLGSITNSRDSSYLDASIKTLMQNIQSELTNEPR